MLELLVAMAVIAAFLSGVIAAFIQILKASERAEATVDAVNNARAALETMANDIKSASIDPSQIPQHFFGIDARLGSGDGIDNDRDGLIDEEIFNGLDDDGDWSLADDNHAIINGFIERSAFVGVPDLGDFRVDEEIGRAHV